MWDDTTTGNGCFDERVQFLVSSDGQLQVARCDTFHLEILGSVTGQLEHFGGEVLCEVRTTHGRVPGSVFLPPFTHPFVGTRTLRVRLHVPKMAAQ